MFARLLCLFCLMALPLRADPLPVAVFDLSFINFSQEVEFGEKNEAEHARIAMLTTHLRQRLAESGRYALLDTAPLAADLDKHGEVFTCNHCEAAMARKIGAARSFSGAVQKLSVLVQTVILRERNAETGEVVALYQTDIRGNTDIAWRRGMDFLIDERLLTGPP
ncbi:DUF3280 domain-containing protein [Salipiger abyssi]|uniref:DUF3280 domain-containing protein n=1 Tax=Salipiger abyssi TaxID=1250539 RepID=UPI001A8F2E56|nr:DUF3280 domain-containing protein [Salipiger abyssi]MBN9889571.1 DUF3280 domain-containing protein [Salipiger abyssi]